MTLIVSQYNQDKLENLIDHWLTQEQNGIQYPVDFDVAWAIAGYSEKGKGKRRLVSKSSHLVENEDYIIEKGVFTRSGKSALNGRSGDSIKMTCDAFKQFCLLAETDQGREIRQYFIECEKKWRIVQKVDPSFAQEIEILKLKAEISKNEAIKAKAEEKTINLRHYVVTALPEPIQQKILGYQVIKEVERVESVIDKSTGKSYDGVGISYIAKSLGLTNKEAWGFLERIGYGSNSDKWHSELTAIESKKLAREDFEYIKDVFKNYKHRQLFIGE